MTSELLRVLLISDVVTVCTSYLQGFISINFAVLDCALHDKDEYYKSCFFDKMGRHSAYHMGVIHASISLHNTPKEYLANPFQVYKERYMLPWRRTAFYQGYNTYKLLTNPLYKPS